jgi:hypothetical protein
MDREQLAARIGSRYVRNAMFVGLGLAMLIFLLIGEGKPEAVFDLVMDWPVQAFICLVIGPLIGHVVGAWAGKKILLYDWNAWLVSPMVGFACVWATTFLFSLVGYFNEGIHGWDSEHAVRDYIVNPLLSVTLVGGLFILLESIVMAAFFDRARRTHFSAQP